MNDDGVLSSGISSRVEFSAIGSGGEIDITTGELSVTNSGQITTSTEGQGSGGNIEIDSNSLFLGNDTEINSRSFGSENAGNIFIKVLGNLDANFSQISSSSSFSAGGEIKITASNINLRGNSDIRTDVASDEGGGGNITLTAQSITAFDDSDIFAFAEGEGGNIVLDTPAFFAENFTLNSLTEDPEGLDNNIRADINATGAVSGFVTIPDVSFIQNSLTELPDNSINTDELVANSCVAPVGNRQQSTFIITGGEGLPVRPGNAEIAEYPTGRVRSIPDNDSSWQRGDRIIEPQGVYQLNNGKLVLSRECSR